MNDDDMIGDLLGDLAKYRARQAWVSCWDVDGSSAEFKRLHKCVERFQRRIDDIKSGLLEELSEDELGVLFDARILIDEAEQEIERSERPHQVHFNKNALIILTNTSVPEDVQLALSFGYKFLFPYRISNSNIHEILAQLEMTIEQAIPDLSQLEASIEICRILKNRSNFSCNDPSNWFKFVCYRTVSFFKMNPHIFATRSDKGGHTVIMDESDYRIKLTRHLADDAYTPINDPGWLEALVSEEVELVDILMNNPKVVELIEGSKVPAYEPLTLSLPKFYGLPKIHKNDCPLRPITSTLGAVGYQVSKIFHFILKKVFPRTEYHIKDSYELIKFFDGVRLSFGDVLVSFDVVSMYTSIPFQLVYKIVMGSASLFDHFGINRGLLSRILIFCLKKCMIFTALEDTYKQNFGLPMGSCLSPLMARIVMDEVVKFLLEFVPDITFIRIFVDDTIVALNGDKVNDALLILNSFLPDELRFTLERENELGDINFLNMTLRRESRQGDNGNREFCICTNWHRKYYASGRLLNFYSSHKRSTILATAAHFIKTVLILSDPKFFHENRERVLETLRENSFPENVIHALVSDFYTYMKPLHKHLCDSPEDGAGPINFVREGEVVDATKLFSGNAEQSEDKEYVIFPHSIYNAKRIKGIIHGLSSPGIVLAESVRNTKINSVTTRKTVTPGEKRSNMVVFSQCACKNKYIVTSTGFNENAGMVRRRIAQKSVSVCSASRHAYKDFKYFKGLFYKSQTSYLIRYIQWKYRHKLDAFTCRYQFPNNLLNKLVGCSCCKDKRRAT